MNLKKNAVMWAVVLGIVLVATAALYVATRDKGSIADILPIQGSYTLEEVAAANTKERCYAAIGDGVYDMTKFAQADARVVSLCGTDATAAVAQLGPTAMESFASIRIGNVTR